MTYVSYIMTVRLAISGFEYLAGTAREGAIYGRDVRVTAHVNISLEGM